MKQTAFAVSVALLTSTASLGIHAQDMALMAAKPEKHMQQVLDALAALNGKPIESLSASEARLQPSAADAANKVLADKGKDELPDPSVMINDMQLSLNGSQVPVHIYTPKGQGPMPVLVYFHGGGFVIADTHTYDASIRALAKDAKAIVVSVDYDRAPERPFPAASDEAYAAFGWVRQHAQEFQGDPKRVAVGGESAGGNLAAVVSLMARDRHEPMPVHQLLIYPVVDNNMATPSYKTYAQVKPLNAAMMSWFFDKYNTSPANLSNPYMLPMKAKSLSDLPSATVIGAEIDPLMSEGKAYADRLQVDGVKVEYRLFKGVTHEFFGMGKVVPEAKSAEKFAANQLKAAFNANTAITQQLYKGH